MWDGISFDTIFERSSADILTSKAKIPNRLLPVEGIYSMVHLLVCLR